MLHPVSPLECLRHAVSAFDPDIVLFDTEFIFETVAQAALKEMLDFCRTRRIGVATIFNSTRSSSHLPPWLRSQSDHHFQIRPIPQQTAYAFESYKGVSKAQSKWSCLTGGRSISEISSEDLRKTPLGK